MAACNRHFDLIWVTWGVNPTHVQYSCKHSWGTLWSSLWIITVLKSADSHLVSKQMTHNICFILLAVDKENNNDPLKIWGLYLFVLAFPGECVNQLGSEVKSIPERSAGWFKTLDVWHRLMLCDIKINIFFIDMKFGINQAISQTITQLSCIQLETPSSRLWNFWWIKTYTTFNWIPVWLHPISHGIGCRKYRWRTSLKNSHLRMADPAAT